jgi:hypothetical protein
MKIEVVSKDVGVKKNDAKVQIAKEYSVAHPRIKLQSKCL